MKKLLTLALALVLCLSLAACGGSKEETPAETTETPTETETPAETTVLNVAASATPHAEILEECVPILAEQGIDLQIHVYGDYVVPNTAVEEGAEDANYFQHVPYLDNFNAENGTHLVSVAGVHIEPMGIYAGKTASLEELADGASVAVPNDVTNEARALLLLQENGIIKLRDGAGITATKNDIVENPFNVEIVEAEAAQLPNQLQDVDYAVINSNYAINAGLNPVADSLAIEGSASAYGNILAVKEGNENKPKLLALKAALESQQVADFITEKYAGAVVSVVENPTDGYDASLDYDALKGETITVAASPTPHAEILEVAKEILAAKDITLDIQVYNDYVVPNTVVDDGTVDANYFQHIPYLDDFNAQQGTHIVSISAIHVEPMGLYGGKQTTLDAVTSK